MEGSNKIPTMNHQDFLLSFQDLSLGKNLTSPCNNATSLYNQEKVCTKADNFPLVKDGFNPKESMKTLAIPSDYGTTNPLSNCGYDGSFSWLNCSSNNGSMTQHGAVQSLQWPSTSSSNIWAYDNNYFTKNGISNTNSSQKSLLDYANIYQHYEYGSSSTSNAMNQSNYEKYLGNNMLNNSSCIGAQEFGKGVQQGILDSYELPLDYKDWSQEDYSKCIDDLFNQTVAALHYGYLPKPGFDIVKMAKDPGSSRVLQKFLELNNYYFRQRILNEILGSFYEVMIDEHGHSFFVKLVESCNDEQIELILQMFLCNLDFFVQTAFIKYGSKSIQMIIKILKKKPRFATYCSQIVSFRLVELMTHRTGRYVVEQCFHMFNEKQNDLLYRGVLNHFREVATDESGCASLNICIDCITNPLRRELLEKIAIQSGYLANDPWGNYVVQHVVQLRDEEISGMIFRQLEKQYLTLAYKKGGSHVVEKCIESSKSGMISVVDVLLGDEKALVQLAKDPFGNYVVQTALKSTKEHGEERRHQALVRVLMSRSWILDNYRRGKHVITLIKSPNTGFSKKAALNP